MERPLSALEKGADARRAVGVTPNRDPAEDARAENDDEKDHGERRRQRRAGGQMGFAMIPHRRSPWDILLTGEAVRSVCRHRDPAEVPAWLHGVRSGI
jgi:hypothetical protein